MSLKISASTPLKYHYLVVTESGIRYSQTFGFSSPRAFSFGSIDLVIMSPKNVLSFQVGEEVFSIPFKPHRAKHRAALAALVEGVRRSDPGCKDALAPPALEFT